MKNLEIKEYKNKYKIAAEEIYAILGTNNYSNIFNCMTRFRANVIDKSLVNTDEIKKLPIVKGIHWNGNELQIIIGAEVYKVVDEFKKYENEVNTPIKDKQDIQIKSKKSIGGRILQALMGIMGPVIPLLLTAGMLSGIYSLLTLPEGANLLTTSVMNDGKLVSIDMSNLYLFDIWSALFFVLNKVLLTSLGVFVAFYTARYFKGNTALTLAIAITLMSRAFFPVGGTPWDQASFGDWTSNMSKTGFLLFKLGDYPIVVGGYEGTIIPFFIAGVVVTYLDKWIKSWMPSMVDTVFRPVLVYTLAIFGLWFVLAPIAGIIEYGLIQGLYGIDKIPYGIGDAIVGALFQPFILTGAHNAIVVPMIAGYDPATPSTLGPCLILGVWSQIAAVIGVAIKTKNTTLRKVAIGCIPAGIFGITEPAIYGVNLPKVKPFLMGCIATGLVSLFSVNIGLACVHPAGLGIFALLQYQVSAKWTALALLSWVMVIALTIILVVVFYTERKNELSYFKKGVNKFIKLINGNKTNNEFETFETEIKSMKNDYKKMDKYYSDISKYEQQLISIEEKESKHRSKMYQELIKLKSKLLKKDNQLLLTKFNKLNEEYSKYNLDKEKEIAQNKLNKVMSSNEQLLNKFNQEKNIIYQNASSKITLPNETDKLIIQNIMWNALNSVEIGYGIEDAKPTKFKE